MTSLQKTRTVVEDLLRDEAALVHACAEFVEDAGDRALAARVEALRSERQEHVGRLRNMLFALPRPDEVAGTSGAWRNFAAPTAAVDDLGTRARLSVLRYEVERLVDAYEHVLESADMHEDFKALVRDSLHPRAVEHAAELRRYLAVTWGPRAVPAAPSWSTRSGGAWGRGGAWAGGAEPRH